MFSKYQKQPRHRNLIYLPLDGLIRLPYGFTSQRYPRSRKDDWWVPSLDRHDRQVLNPEVIPPLHRDQDRFHLVGFSSHPKREHENHSETYPHLIGLLRAQGIWLDALVWSSGRHGFLMRLDPRTGLYSTEPWGHGPLWRVEDYYQPNHTILVSNRQPSKRSVRTNSVWQYRQWFGEFF